MIILTVLLAAFAGLGSWLYTPDASRASLEAKYVTAADSFLPLSGITLHVRDTGPRDAPAIVLLHGFGASLQTWEPWAVRLSATYRVVSFDLPGFGLTGADATGDYSDTHDLAVLDMMMDRLGLARATLIGNSLGGRIAWNFALAHPDRVTRLVLISPDGFASPGFEYGKTPDVPTMLRLLPYTLPTMMVRMSLAPAYGQSSRLSDATVTRYRDMMLAPGVRLAIIARMQQVMLQDPVPLLRRIQTPTLLLWGRQDGMIPFANSADYLRDLPHATLVALPGLGHVPFEEDPDTSIEPVLRFLATP